MRYLRYVRSLFEPWRGLIFYPPRQTHHIKMNLHAKFHWWWRVFVLIMYPKIAFSLTSAMKRHSWSQTLSELWPVSGFEADSVKFNRKRSVCETATTEQRLWGLRRIVSEGKRRRLIGTPCATDSYSLLDLNLSYDRLEQVFYSFIPT